MPILAFWSGPHLSAQLVRHEVKSVTDAQDWVPERKHSLIGRWRIGVIHRARTARQHDSRRPIALDLINRSGAGQDHREDALFADAACNKLGVLRTEVEDYDGLGVHDLLSSISD